MSAIANIFYDLIFKNDSFDMGFQLPCPTEIVASLYSDSSQMSSIKDWYWVSGNEVSFFPNTTLVTTSTVQLQAHYLPC